MTKILYSTGITPSIKISGHAGAKRVSGCDLCCAAESMLAYTLIENIYRYNLKKYEIYIYDGYVYVRFKVNSIKSLCALISFKTIINGFKLLKKKYPENVFIQKQKEVEFDEQIFN